MSPDRANDHIINHIDGLDKFFAKSWDCNVPTYIKGQKNDEVMAYFEKIRKFRRSKEYVAWQKAVISKAGGECEKCGITSNVEAHHVVSLHKDFTKSLNIDNGQALCKACHKKIDWRK